MDHNPQFADDETLSRLVELDRLGFILPPGADPAGFVAAADETLEWAEGIRRCLRGDGRAEVLDEEFTEEQSVPDDVLGRCLAPAAERYSVSPGWVPAFFSKSLLPWYVGGACFYFVDENKRLRVCFVLSDRFRERRKWLFYSRSEIISHEICHVARSMMNQDVFEEPLAYGISESLLRRGLGPVFRGTWEATAVLAGSLMLFLGSLAGSLGAPQGVKYIAAVPLLAASAFLTLRTVDAHRTLKRAVENLNPVYGENARAVLFRCTDREIREIAHNENARRTVGQYPNDGAQNVRWTVINRLFGAAEVSPR